MAMEMAMESMEMAPGAISRPVRVPEQSFCPPNLVCDGGGATELFVDRGFRLQGFPDS